MKAALKFALVALALMVGTAKAVGLGEIQVHSYLNQPLSAKIPVVVDSNNALADLSVGLASADAFKRANIPFDDSLASLQFKLVTNQGSPYVMVTSSRIIRVPFLNFLVQAQSGGTTLMRQYTVLLDPPPAAAIRQTKPVAIAAPAAVAPSPVPKTAAASPPPSPSPVRTPAPAHRPTPVHQPPPAHRPTSAAKTTHVAPPATSTPKNVSRYGPVEAQDTLWSIGKKLRPSTKVSVAQTVLALYRANPRAFKNDDINALMKGATLQVPNVQTIAAVPPAQAEQQLKDLLRGGPTGTAPPPPASGTETTAPTRPPKTTAAPASKPKAAAASQGLPSASENTAPAAQSAAAESEQPAAATTTMAAVTKPASELAKPASTSPAVVSGAQSSPGPNPVAPTGPVAGKTAASTRPAAPTNPAAPPKATTPQSLLGRLRAEFNQLVGGLLAPWQAALILLAVAVVAGLLLFQHSRRNIDSDDGYGARMKMAPQSDVAAPTVEPVETEPSASEGTDEVPPPGGDEEQAEASQAAGDGTETAAEPTQEEAPADAAVGDVIADADFHIAYGLHDEAISMLTQAIESHPERIELKQKLAEAYYAAERPTEFQQLAEELHGLVAPAAWASIAEMGRKLVPTATLFESEDATSVQLPEPDEQEAAAEAGDELLQPDEPEASIQTPQAQDDRGIEFDAADSSEPALVENEPQIDLSEFDLQTHADTAETAAPTEAERIDFKLDDFDLEATPADEEQAAPVEKPAETEPMPAAAPAPASIVSDDESSTKLDLARAYADIGDNAAAQALLDEVRQGGSPEQRREAEEIARRLSAG